MNNGVVTVIDGKVTYWANKEAAIEKLNSFYDYDKVGSVLDKLRLGVKICTDAEYDISTMLSCQLALRLGYFV